MPTTNDGLRTFKVRTANGVRDWQAEDLEHAREQHDDAFAGHPGEAIESFEIVTPYGTATIGPDSCAVKADNHELWSWARRPGHHWPCSDLAELDSITVGFDSGGLVDLEQAPSGPDSAYNGPDACPNCGRPITLQPSGWWSHDGMPNGCWRLSMDGPDTDDSGAVEISGAELSAWSSDVLRETLPGDHPCWLVTVGQFIEREDWPESAVKVWG